MRLPVFRDFSPETTRPLRRYFSADAPNLLFRGLPASGGERVRLSGLDDRGNLGVGRAGACLLPQCCHPERLANPRAAPAKPERAEGGELCEGSKYLRSRPEGGESVGQNLAS